MVMQMLAAGGMTCDGEYPSYEQYQPLYDKWAGYPLHKGGAVKILDAALRVGPPPATGSRFIYLTRNDEQQGRSMAKLLRITMGLNADWRRLPASICRDNSILSSSLGNRGDIMVARFEEILARPWAEAVRIAAFLDGDLDVRAMTDAVISRTPGCLPDMSLEERQMRYAGLL